MGETDERFEQILSRRDRERLKAERELKRIVQENLIKDDESVNGDGDIDKHDDLQEAVAGAGLSKRPCRAEAIEPPGPIKWLFGIGKADDRTPASRMVHPSSRFHVMWTALTAGFLIYTALVVPAEIAFHWLDKECVAVPTLLFDCVLDTFFLMDICYSFCVGIIRQVHDTHTHTHARARAHAHARTHTHAHTHARTHTHNTHHASAHTDTHAP